MFFITILYTFISCVAYNIIKVGQNITKNVFNVLCSSYFNQYRENSRKSRAIGGCYPTYYPLLALLAMYARIARNVRALHTAVYIYLVSDEMWWRWPTENVDILFAFRYLILRKDVRGQNKNFFLFFLLSVWEVGWKWA